MRVLTTPFITLLFTSWILMASTTVQSKTLEFTDRDDLPRFGTVNDTVMGGRSRSAVMPGSDAHLFQGSVSLENNGGFASVRYLIGPSLPDADQVELTVRGDGKLYQLRFQMGGQYRAVSYAVRFQTLADEWQTFRFPVADFRPVWRGREVTGAPPLTMEKADRVSIYITDKQTGPFQLELATLHFR